MYTRCMRQKYSHHPSTVSGPADSVQGVHKEENGAMERRSENSRRFEQFR